MQMLQSLEAGGDLADTPMSGDSYNVGDNLETGMETPRPRPVFADSRCCRSSCSRS